MSLIQRVSAALQLGLYIGNSISESAAVHPILRIKLEGVQERVWGFAEERVRIVV